jgi:hypothetical protein
VKTIALVLVVPWSIAMTYPAITLSFATHIAVVSPFKNMGKPFEGRVPVPARLPNLANAHEE